MKIRDYVEVASLAHIYVEESGISYEDAIKRAKEKLFPDRVGAHKSENNISKTIKDSITEKDTIEN